MEAVNDEDDDHAVSPGSVGVSLDLTEIHNLGYYTGITFEVLAHGVGYRLASGGRYDNLVGSFGSPQPAVCEAFGLE